MYIQFIALFAAFLLGGLLGTYYLFKQEKNGKKSNHFLLSEKLFVFVIEIIIAVLGFGITLSITNANERQVEKDKAIQMLEQTIEYTDKQLAKERSYLNGYKDGEYTDKQMLASNVISLDYYRNVLSNEVILQNANMNTYGELMTYLIWVEHYDDNAKAEDCDDLYQQMFRRYKYLGKFRELLEVCYDELSEKISAEEAKDRVYVIKYDKKAEAS